MSFLGGILGFGANNNNNSSGNSSNNENKTAGSSISGAETIERLCDRLQSASLLEDRRESLITIKSLSKKYRLEVGTQAMPVLIDVIDKNRSDSEMCCLALDALYNVMAVNPENIGESAEQTSKVLPNDLNIQFTEMFIKTGTNVTLIFDLLDEYEFKTRLSTLKLLNVFVLNQTQQLQEIILQIPRGVSRLMDLLNDTREVIRNDKIIAFESGFDRIMEIIESEGSAADGGIVVEDCFNLLLNLLKMNYSNQNYFKEANYIKMLCKYLDLTENNNNNSNNHMTNLASDLGDPNNSGAWTVQKTTNLMLLLKLIRCLVSPTNQQMIINDCQKAFNHFGMLHRLCAMLMMPGVPADLLSECIGTVGEVIRGNQSNQQLFSAVQMQTRPIIVILLMSMINEKQPFHLRCSILYCFECLLYKNETTKTFIIETLLPKQQASNTNNNNSSSVVDDQVNMGQILCSGLFNQHDPISSWLCAVALSHTINENNQLKEQLLRVQLALKQQMPVSLMQQCMIILIESNVDKTAANSTVSMLMLLSTWLSNCPLAVNYFLAYPQNIPYLISQVSSTDTEEKSLIIQGLTAFLLGLCMLYNTNQVESYTIDKLKDIIKKRCGIEQFEDKLEYISQHESYTKTLRMPTFSIKSKKIISTDLLFDYEFVRLFKSNETLILNLLQNKNQNIQSSLSSIVASPTIEQQNSLIINQYQQIIRDQDAKIKQSHQEQQTLIQTCNQLQEYCQSLHASFAVKDEFMKERSHEFDLFSTDKLKLQAKINELEVKNNLLEEKCSEQEDELCKLQREKGIYEEKLTNLNQSDSNVEIIDLKTQNKQLKLDLQNLNTEQDNLLTLLQEMEQKLKLYKNLLKESGYTQLSADESEDENDIQNTQLETTSSKNNQQQQIQIQDDHNHNQAQEEYEDNDYGESSSNHQYYDENNRMNQIIQAKNMSNSNSSNSLGPNAADGGEHCSLSSITSSSNTSNETNEHDHKSNHLNFLNKMNYPPQTGQNIMASTNPNPNTVGGGGGGNVVDPFFQNHPFFSQLQQSAHDKQEHSNPLQNYFK